VASQAHSLHGALSARMSALVEATRRTLGRFSGEP